MHAAAELLKFVGAILGIAAFSWKIADALRSYLHIGLKAEVKDGWLNARTEVTNKGQLAKKIDGAFLLVGPAGESPTDTARELYPGVQIKVTNDFADLPLDSERWNEGRGLVPLPFFYSEQVSIGDESLSYSVLIPPSRLTADTVSELRFYIFTNGRLHRSTQDAVRAVGDAYENAST